MVIVPTQAKKELSLSHYWPLLHGVLFYFIWYFAVLAVSIPRSEQWALLLQGAFVATSIAFSSVPIIKKIKYIFILSLIGSLIDSIPLYFGFLQTPHTRLYAGHYPVWLIGMWSCFATAIPTSLAWMNRKLIAQILFGAFGGPLSLYAAYQIGAVSFPYPLSSTLPLFACEWALIMPLIFLITQRSGLLPHEKQSRLF